MTVPAALLARLPDNWQDKLRQADIEPVPAGQCNQVFRVDTGKDRLALRINHPHPEALGIDPAREQSVLRSIAGQAWAPDVLLNTSECLLSRWVIGDYPAGGELTRVNWLAHALDTVHRHDGTWPVIDVPQQLRQLARRCGDLTPLIQARVDALLADYRPPTRLTLCHHDWHPGNLLIHASGWTLLDWEFAGAGDPLLDIGAAINGFALASRQVTALSRLTGFSVTQLKHGSAIMRALEVVWYAANPSLAPNSQHRLRHWLDDTAEPDHRKAH